MIPHAWGFEITCDNCGAQKTVVLESENIESDGLDFVLEGKLNESG